MAFDVSRRDVLRFGLVAAGAVTGVAAVGAVSEAASADATGAPATDPPSPMPRLAQAWQQAPQILRRVTPPTFRDASFDITAYGAVGDGSTDSTNAIRAAVADCARSGGGHVVVPSGTFVSGAIHLQSGVDLHLDDGAVLRGSTDLEQYLPNVYTRWQGIECYNYSPLIYANGQQNVAVTGTGTIDGQGTVASWHSWGGGGADWTALQQMGADGVPVEQRQFGAGHKLRPNMVQFYGCQNVLVADLTLVNPPMWTVHPVLCSNVTVRDITVHSTISNGDGCDPECSSDVHIDGCRFDTNDDCIAIKAGRDADGRRVNVPSQDIVVENCEFSGRWGGITIGSEMSGGVRNVFARDCRINPPDFPGMYPVKYALYAKSNQARGGFIEDIYLKDFTGQNVERQAIYVTMNYSGGDDETYFPTVERIAVQGMLIDGAQAVLYLDGLATDHLDDVTVANSEFSDITGQDTVDNTDDLTLFQVTVNGQPAT